MPHIHEKIDFTVEVFIVYKDKVLLRMHDKFKQWLSVGGHIELDEDPIQAAHREVKEEVGLDIELVGNPVLLEDVEQGRVLLTPIGLSRHFATPTHEHVVLIYFACAKNDEIKVLHEGDKSEECRWCTKEDIETMELWSSIRGYALAALRRLGQKSA